ncbi:hypothetical protein G9A89_007104 [Geosiphon pyriformis]|nr:hypothetical protein G9A89_007104 [Geosiphon pyriformis]
MDKHSSPSTPQSTSGSLLGLHRSVYSLLELLNGPVPERSPAVVLIVVAILIALAIVYKQVTDSDRQQQYQQPSEKFRLHMAGSMVGDFFKKMFNPLTTSRQESTTSTTSEKSKRLSIDISSSSSTSLSLPTHDATPRLYQKNSNSQLSSHRRHNSRHKQPGQIPSVNTHIPTGYFPSASSSSNCSSDENSPISIDREEEAKSTVTIDVSEPLLIRNEQNREDASHHQNEEIKNLLSEGPVDFRNGPESPSSKLIKELTDPCLDEKSCNFSSNNSSSHEKETSQLQLNGAKSAIMIDFGGQVRNQINSNNVSINQESDAEGGSIISDDHSDLSLHNKAPSYTPNEQKSVEDTGQNGHSNKSNNRRRRRRTRGKNNKQQNIQREQQAQQAVTTVSKGDQSLDSLNQELTPPQLAKTPRPRQGVEPARSSNFSTWPKSSRPQQANPPQYLPQVQQTQPHSNSTFFSTNKKLMSNYNSSNPLGTTLPQQIKVPSTEIYKKPLLYPRSDVEWRLNVPAASHHSLSRSVSNPSLGLSISRFTSYADVIAPNNSRPQSSMASNSIISPNATNSTTNDNSTNNGHWYTPFSSGFTIQLTPPASPKINHASLLSETNTSTFSFFSDLPVLPSMASSQELYRSDQINLRPPIAAASPSSFPFTSTSAASSASPESTFGSSHFPSLTSAHNNHQPSSIPTSFASSIFGRKFPLSDQEKGQLLGEEKSKSWNGNLDNVTGLSNESSWNLELAATMRPQAKFELWDGNSKNNNSSNNNNNNKSATSDEGAWKLELAVNGLRQVAAETDKSVQRNQRQRLHRASEYSFFDKRSSFGNLQKF